MLPFVVTPCMADDPSGDNNRAVVKGHAQISRIDVRFIDHRRRIPHFVTNISLTYKSVLLILPCVPWGISTTSRKRIYNPIKKEARNAKNQNH